MKTIRPIIIFLTLLSMGLTLYGQKIIEKPVFDQGNAEVRLSINDEDGRIEIYPNPATEFININLSDANLSKAKFELYDIIGNKVDVEAQETKHDNYRISVEKLHMGYYVLIVSDSYGRYKKAFKFSKR
jgi:hypothetical protein